MAEKEGWVKLAEELAGTFCLCWMIRWRAGISPCSFCDLLGGSCHQAKMPARRPLPMLPTSDLRMMVPRSPPDVTGAPVARTGRPSWEGPELIP